MSTTEAEGNLFGGDGNVTGDSIKHESEDFNFVFSSSFLVLRAIYEHFLVLGIVA